MSTQSGAKREDLAALTAKKRQDVAKRHATLVDEAPASIRQKAAQEAVDATGSKQARDGVGYAELKFWALVETSLGDLHLVEDRNQRAKFPSVSKLQNQYGEFLFNKFSKYQITAIWLFRTQEEAIEFSETYKAKKIENQVAMELAKQSALAKGQAKSSK